MKRTMEWVAAVGIVLAGCALMCSPGHAAAPFTPTRFTVVDGGTAGKPDLVLIPGLASSRAVWDAEAAKLAPNFRLHIVQVNGFAGQAAGSNAGSTDLLPGIVEELHAYLAANGMHPAVVGHSLGGLLTLMLADRYPGDASKLILVDSLPYYAVVFNKDATVENTREQATTIRQQMLAMPDDQFAAMQPAMVAMMVKNAEGQKLVAASSAASDRTVFADAMFEDLQTDLRGEVAKIKTPMLMVYPYDAAVVKDAAAVDAVYQTAYKPMPNVRLVRIDDSRHFIMYDQPAKLDAAIEAFLRG